MKPEIKKIWTDDLNSGENEQGIGRLHCDNKWCCLGRLQELYRQQTGDGEWVGDEEGEYRFVHNDDNGAIFYLSQKVCEWAGLFNENGQYESNPMVMCDGRAEHLGSLNDGGVKFPEIAKLIEESL